MEGQEGADVEGGGEEKDHKRQKERSGKQVLRTKFFKHTHMITEEAPHIMEMFNEAHQILGTKTDVSKRQTQSDIIKNCFRRSEDGKHWRLDLKSPFFNQAKKWYS